MRENTANFVQDNRKMKFLQFYREKMQQSSYLLYYSLLFGHISVKILQDKNLSMGYQV